MSLHAMEIPDDPAQLPGWLEGHLLGLDLAELVAELTAVHGPAPRDGLSLQHVLGTRQGAMLASGLRELPPETLRQFLVRPQLLLDLQELILTEGSRYWDRPAPPAAGLREQVERGRRHLETFLAAEGQRAAPARQTVPSERAVAWYRLPSVVSLATAAAVLLAVGVYQHYRPSEPVQPGGPMAAAPTGWGWNKPDALVQNVPADAYLKRLADGAEEWFKKRPDEPADLAKRLAEMRQGCSMLIFAAHQPLAQLDRAWLVEECRAWGGRLDRHLRALESGGLAVAEVRTEADATVNLMIATLRQRARELAAG